MIPIMDFDVIIIGGGLVGASLAASLKHSGLTLALLENQPATELDKPSEQDWDSRIYAISPGSRDFLIRCGAWQRLDPTRIEPVTTMRIFGDTQAELEFSAYQMGVAELACILENRALQHALSQGLQQQENLTLLQPAVCASVTFSDTAARLTLADGKILHSKLVVGADGRDSWLRRQAGIEFSAKDYQQYATVANFSCEQAHRGIAYQWFQNDGVLALLPLPGQRVSMVWSADLEKSTRLQALSAEQLCAEVAGAAQDKLGRLQLITPANHFPLQQISVPHISAPRVALIGDAAHHFHPLAGQGVNIGFHDANQLAQLLIERGAQPDCGATQLLRRYERKRKEDIVAMQLTTDGLKRLFNNDDVTLRALRNGGLNIVNRLTPLKKMLLRHALL